VEVWGYQDSLFDGVGGKVVSHAYQLDISAGEDGSRVRVRSLRVNAAGADIENSARYFIQEDEGRTCLGGGTCEETKKLETTKVINYGTDNSFNGKESELRQWRSGEAVYVENGGAANPQNFKDLADSIFEQQKGLSIFDTLPPATGMFFIFDKDDQYGIWMKDMKFAIDIIWIDSEGRIVDIVENATPESYPKIFTSKKPAPYVLEVASGFVRQRGISTGDIIDFSSVAN